MTSQFSQRIKVVRAKLDEWEVDAILVGSASNLRWLSGFTGSFAWLLVSKDIAALATDSRYWEQARNQAPDFTLNQFGRSVKEEMPEFLVRENVKKIGIEVEHITLSQFAQLKAIEVIDWVEVEDAVTPLREAKTKEEVEKVRVAAAITDQAMEQVPLILRPGMTERELAWKLEVLMREAGADGMAFPIIVASGPNGAMAHHTPSDRQLQVGEPLIVDMGAMINGYNGDLTRSFFIGSEPDQRFDEIYSIVLEAQVAAINGIKAGIMGDAADSLARDIISDAGYGEEFGHSLGHGVGLDIHEGPRLSKLAVDQPIPDGSTVTIEPGIYIPGWGGIRIEDLLLVTESGCEYVSHCEKKPYIS
jgi:Xaa-Pro aminopeptidase